MELIGARGSAETEGPESGLGWNALASRLLHAPDFIALALVAAQYATMHHGVDSLRLVWSPASDSELPPPVWSAPEGKLKSREIALVMQAMRENTKAIEDLGAGRVRVAIPLIPRGDSGYAVLLYECVDPQGLDTLEWAAFCTALRASVGPRLDNERLARAVTRLEKAERLQRALFAIADMASADLDMPDMLRGVHGIIGGLMYAENLFIVLYNGVKKTVRFIYFADKNEHRQMQLDTDIPISQLRNSLTVAMIQRGRSFMGPSLQLREQHGLERDDSYGPDSKDWLGVPMVSAHQVRGALVVQSYDQGARFSEEDRVLLSYVAQHILTALERKQAQEDLEQRVEQRTQELARINDELTFEVAERQRGERMQTALFRIAEISSTAESMDKFYAAVHRVIGELLDARNFFIAILSDDGKELDFPYSVDKHDAVRPRRRLAKGMTEYVLRSGRPLLADRSVITRLNARGDVKSFGAPAICWLGVPLICNDRTVGALVVQSYEPNHLFSTRDQELLTFVSYHVATGLMRKRAQDSLREAYAELEQRVDERTRELADTNRELRDQIGERERAELKLKYQALHDALTGLPNRTYLQDRLAHALARYKRNHQHRFAVLFLDLDRFKIINDSVGHLVGDEMLKEASKRIAVQLRSPDIVARLGGDEFAILLEDIGGEADAHGVARRVIQSLTESIRVGDKELFTSTSIGIALSHPRYTRPEELLRDADAAMYRAKARGRQRFEVFDEKLRTEALMLLDLEGDLRRAVSRNEFEPYFQAIVELRSGRVIGYEALLRWKHGERGLLVPGDFLSVAEDSGAIEQIDWQMFDLTCREVPQLSRTGAYVCLNVSPRHFRYPELADAILSLLRTRGIDPSKIRLEVTEGALLENPDQVRNTLERLGREGVLAQLDDFGTGYSSLSYLHQFPIHSLKIDQSFVRGLQAGQGGNGAPVVRAILALASSMGIQVIAEGVETESQRQALIELGCLYGQGFLFARPGDIGSVMQSALRDP